MLSPLLAFSPSLLLTFHLPLHSTQCHLHLHLHLSQFPQTSSPPFLISPKNQRPSLSRVAALVRRRFYPFIIMDTTSVRQQIAAPKRTKPKKSKTATKPFKVVYIANPRKINTTASHFRALVQELTGQDAESPPDPSRFLAAGEDSPPVPAVDSDDSSSKNEDNDNHHKCVEPPPLDPNQTPSIQSFEPFDDDVFTPQMIDNISALIPASVFYESPHLDQW